MPRRRGGQPGNQNARTHGFYSDYARCLRAAKEEKARRMAALSASERELAIARGRLASVLEKTPDNTRVILMAVGAVARAYANSHRHGDALKAGILDALRRADLPSRLTESALDVSVRAARLSPEPGFDSIIESHV
jgi:hypothetical protein